MVAFVVSCGTWVMKFYEGSTITSTGILSRTRNSSFVWKAEGSILVNVGKCSNRTSSFSQLGTSIGEVGRGCVLSVESSLEIVTVFLSPWNRILSISIALGNSGNRETGAERCMVASLENEPFSSFVFYFLAEGPTLMASDNIFLLSLMKSDS